MGKDKKQKKNLAEREKSDESEKTDKKTISKGVKEESILEDTKMTKKADLDDEDSEIEIITLEQQGKRKKKSKSGKASFNVLEIEGESELNDSAGDDNDDDSKVKKKDKTSNVSDIPETKEQVKLDQKSKKKKKKDRKKRDDDDDEDLEKMLEELAIEMGTKTSSERTKGSNETSKLENIEVESEKDVKKKKDEALVEGDSKESSPDATTLSTVKSAAQKKKEKKEREREREKQKKLAELNEQTASKKKSEAIKKKKTDSPGEKLPEEDAATGDAKNVEEEKEEDTDGKKKKKKKKKDEKDEEKKDKKRPGKKQIAAMQEALRRVQDEEEKMRLEEEAKIKAAEEAERLRQEKLRLELEKKEKKKQKEKEKRERLKAEGKLLSKSQRQNRARMEATLAALREKGVEVPNIAEKREKEKGPRLGDRRKMQRKKTNVQESSPEAPKVEELNIANKAVDEPVIEKQTEIEKSPSVSDSENIKDAWYETSDEEDSEEEKQEKKISGPKKDSAGNANDKYMNSESESESSGESDGSTDESESDESLDSSSEGELSKKDGNQTHSVEAIKMRIQKRREVAESNRNMSRLRSPIVCVLGHVDTGKTKILDKIRNTSVQAGEAGGITQQIGATMVPYDALKEQCKMAKSFTEMELKVPGLLIIDTPGHESFSNLRSRGSSLCDVAVLVVDILHGLEPQTIESLNILKQKKTPFVVALNKIDRLYEWKTMKNKDIQDIIKGQSRTTKQFFDDRVKQVILEFANQSLNAVLYYENKDPRTFISMVPTSALTGEGVGNLMALIIELTQTMMSKKIQFSEELQATVLEVKAISGLGHTMDAILVNGRLKEGDTIVFAGYDGPVCSQIRSLLMPHPLKELRVKTQFIEHREVEGAQGIKICGKDLDKAIAGLPLLVPRRSDEVPILMDEMSSMFKEAMNSIKVTATGVYVQTSTLGSLEALMEFLNASKIPVSGVRIGPVTKRDVMKASVMLEHDPTFAVILAFDVRIEKEAQELADSLNIKIFHANIIYHLFDMFVNYRTELKEKNREMYKNAAVFPCKLRILPQFIFNSRDPIVVGVSIEAGVLKAGTPLCVPSKDFLDIGTVSTIEVNHKEIETARKGQEVCIKIEPCGGEAPKMYGRHFDHSDLLVSKISRHSIDMCKEHFRDDLLKTDWQLIVELKKLFQIL